MSKEEISNILTQFTENVTYLFNILEDMIKQLGNFITKVMPVSLFLGVLLSHLDKAFIKKESYISVLISFIGSFISVYYATPFLQNLVTNKAFEGVVFWGIGFFIHYIIKYVTNSRRIQKWLLGIEGFIKDYLKKKFTK